MNGKTLLTGSAVILVAAWASTPVAAQQACDLNGVVQPPPAGGPLAFECGNTADANGIRSTAVGTSAVGNNDDSTAIGARATASIDGLQNQSYNPGIVSNTAVGSQA